MRDSEGLVRIVAEGHPSFLFEFTQAAKVSGAQEYTVAGSKVRFYGSNDIGAMRRSFPPGDPQTVAELVFVFLVTEMASAAVSSLARHIYESAKGRIHTLRINGQQLSEYEDILAVLRVAADTPAHAPPGRRQPTD